MTDRIISMLAWRGHHFRALEIGGGQLSVTDRRLRLILPPQVRGYGDAQFDDVGIASAAVRMLWQRRQFRWHRGTILRLRARFSHSSGQLQGTAGFGFWNAPFGDPTIRWPARPQATWFFYGSPETDLPLAASGPGTGWFAATIDASTGRAFALAPLAPLILLGNQWSFWRRRFWPQIQRHLGISFAPIAQDLAQWHTYDLAWLPDGCQFRVDGRLILSSDQSPRGPLGFVCWLDNQYLTLTANGRFAYGWLRSKETQWLEVADLSLEHTTT